MNLVLLSDFTFWQSPPWRGRACSPRTPPGTSRTSAAALPSKSRTLLVLQIFLCVFKSRYFAANCCFTLFFFHLMNIIKKLIIFILYKKIPGIHKTSIMRTDEWVSQWVDWGWMYKIHFIWSLKKYCSAKIYLRHSVLRGTKMGPYIERYIGRYYILIDR